MRRTLISSRLMGRGGFRAPQNMKPPLRADRGLSGYLNRHDGRIRRSFRLKSSLRTALGLGFPVVPVDWRLEVLSSQGEPHTLILSQLGAPPGPRGARACAPFESAVRILGHREFFIRL